MMSLMVLGARHRVTLIGYTGAQLLDLVGPAEVFAGAGEALGGAAGYELATVTPNGEAIRSSSGLTLQADQALEDVEACDTIVVAGGWNYRTAMRDEAFVDELRRLAERAARVTSVCTGAFSLAAADLLAGRRATTHWAMCRELADSFPEISVEPDRIFVRDGHVLTSAGVSAGMDLALALVEQDHGAEVALKVARWLVLFAQRPGGQSQFSERLAHPIPRSSPLRAVLDEIVANPADDHRVPVLAQKAALSERQFTRLFCRDTGTTPARFVERVRVEAARQMLEHGVAVETVAMRAGFGSSERQRRSFLRILGVSPADYRVRFDRSIDQQERAA
jgi:transcriptional regulator GlxA family with amidase domain